MDTYQAQLIQLKNGYLQLDPAGKTEGCSEEDLQVLALAQHVKTLPTAYRICMLMGGLENNLLDCHPNQYAYQYVRDFKKEALDFISFWEKRGKDNGFVLPPEAFVFQCIDDEVFYYFLCDEKTENPEVRIISDRSGVAERSFETDFFAHVIASIRYKMYFIKNYRDNSE